MTKIKQSINWIANIAMVFYENLLYEYISIVLYKQFNNLNFSKSDGIC